MAFSGAMSMVADSLAQREQIGTRYNAMVADHSNKMAAVARAAHAQSSGLPDEIVSAAGIPLPGSSSSNSTTTTTTSFSWAHAASIIGALLLGTIGPLIWSWMQKQPTNPQNISPTNTQPAVTTPYHIRLLPTTTE